MVLPLYRKIRIPFQIIHDAIIELDDLLEMIRLQFFAGSERPEWDIRLITIADFKHEIFLGGAELFGKDAITTLTASLPKYLWRATGSLASAPCCDLLFDATGLEQSPLLLLAKIYSQDILTMLQSLGAKPTASNEQTSHILDAFTPGSLSKALVLTG